MRAKKFVALWFASGIDGVMMGIAYDKKIPVIGAVTSVAGLMGATVSYTLVHWHDWQKPWKHIAPVVGLAVLDMVIAVFPEGRLLMGPTFGHTIGAIIGFGFGFAFHPTFDNHHSMAVLGGKLAVFAFTFLFYLSILIFLLFVIEVKRKVPDADAAATSTAAAATAAAGT